MRKIEIYDPAMCCPTGVCGPSVDPELTRIANHLFMLEKKGFNVDRYNLTNDADAFVNDKKISRLLHQQGPESLPATVVDGEIVKQGDYPSLKELASWLDIAEQDLTMTKPKNVLDIKTI